MGHPHRHGGHGGHGRSYFGPLYYEVACDPNDPMYQECIRRFGADARFGGLLTPDDLDAITDYFARTQPINPEAQGIKDAYIKWNDGLSWFSKTSQATLDLARNQRNRFALANVATPEDKAAEQNTIETGKSAEQLQGEPDRREQGGMLPGPVAPPPPPLIPEKYIVGGLIFAGLATIAAAYGYGRK